MPELAEVTEAIIVEKDQDERHQSMNWQVVAGQDKATSSLQPMSMAESEQWDQLAHSIEHQRASGQRIMFEMGNSSRDWDY